MSGREEGLKGKAPFLGLEEPEAAVFSPLRAEQGVFGSPLKFWASGRRPSRVSCNQKGKQFLISIPISFNIWKTKYSALVFILLAFCQRT